MNWRVICPQRLGGGGRGQHLLQADPGLPGGQIAPPHVLGQSDPPVGSILPFALLPQLTPVFSQTCLPRGHLRDADLRLRANIKFIGYNLLQPRPPASRLRSMPPLLVSLPSRPFPLQSAQAAQRLSSSDAGVAALQQSPNHSRVFGNAAYPGDSGASECNTNHSKLSTPQIRGNI